MKMLHDDFTSLAHEFGKESARLLAPSPFFLSLSVP